MTVYPELTFEYKGITYPVWDQTQLGSKYLARHGCSFCALATMIHALTDPSVTPLTLRENAGKLLGGHTGRPLGGKSFGGYADRKSIGGHAGGKSFGGQRPQYSRIQRAVQRKPLTELLTWSDRMPLNLAGAARILECYMNVEYLDSGSDEDIRRFILSKVGYSDSSSGPAGSANNSNSACSTGRSLPILATGRYIPSVRGDDLCPHTTHTFLIIGMADADTLIVCDSSGATKERIKYVRMDDLIRGIYRRGIERGLARRAYYFTPATAGGLLAPRGE